MWETGQKGQLERKLHRITNLEEDLNKNKVHLSVLPIKRENFGDTVDSLSGSIIAPVSLFLACLLWESCSSGLAAPDQNLCWWPQRGPLWGMTIFLTVSTCPSTTPSFPPPSPLHHRCGSPPLPTLRTELCCPLHIRSPNPTTVFTHGLPPSFTFWKSNPVFKINLLFLNTLGFTENCKDSTESSHIIHSRFHYYSYGRFFIINKPILICYC